MRIIKTIASLAVLFLAGCQQPKEKSNESAPPMNWMERVSEVSPTDSLSEGRSYLAVYSEIYSYTSEQTFQLTATVSIHNASLQDTLFLKAADYYNTDGKLIRSYLEKTAFVKPLETVQIIIDETDESGGPGANFIFEWATNSTTRPFFEGVMISTSGQQGMSFTTQGREIE